MAASIAGIIVFISLALVVHQGAYAAPAFPAKSSARECLEAGLLAGCLLAIPHLRLSFAWFEGWLGPYLMLLLATPLAMELALRRRSLATVGLRRPVNRRALMVVAVLLALFIVARLAQPVLSGRALHLDLRLTLRNAVIFAFLEELMFRGLIQTRLETAMGAVPAWIASGLFFGFYHLYVKCLAPGAAIAAHLLPVAYVTALGLLLGVVFAKTRSLLPSFLIHALNNLSL